MTKRSACKISRKRKILSTLIYSRFIIVTVMLMLQAVLYFFACYKLQSRIHIFLGAHVIAGFIFMIYLVNSSMRNEFKITWMIPALIVPLFGISLYVFTKHNWGGTKFKKQIQRVKDDSRQYIPNEEVLNQDWEKFSQIKDIAFYLKQSGNFPSYSNCATHFYENGESFFPEMLDAIKKARKFIFMEYFIIEAGKVWEEILDVLKLKAASGVEIRVLYDSIGSPIFSSKMYVDYLNSFGIQAQIFMPFVPVFDTSLNNRNHHKILVVDGKVAFTGGLNLSDEYMNIDHSRFDYWKDTAIKIQGGAVNSYTVIFLQMWNIQRFKQRKVEDFSKYINPYFKIYETNGVVIPYSDDAFNSFAIAEDIYFYILNKAMKYVHIMSPYMIIDHKLLNAIKFAVNRGVEVEVIFPFHFDHFITYCVGITYLKDLISSGVKVYTYNPGFMHAKIFVSDDSLGTVGTVNLDYRSLYHHFECGALLYRTESIRKIEKDFCETKENCTELTMERYKKYPKLRRLIGWIFSLFSPVL